MPEFDKITYSKPRPLGNWSAEEHLIQNLAQVWSERQWDKYVKTDLGTQVMFVYEDAVEEVDEDEVDMEGFEL